MGRQWWPKPLAVADTGLFKLTECASNDGLQKEKIKLQEDIMAKTEMIWRLRGIELGKEKNSITLLRKKWKSLQAAVGRKGLLEKTGDGGDGLKMTAEWYQRQQELDGRKPYSRERVNIRGEPAGETNMGLPLYRLLAARRKNDYSLFLYRYTFKILAPKP